MVVHLLVLGAVVSHEGASGHDEVGACCIQSFVNEEIFLLPSQVGNDLPDIGVEISADVGCCAVNGLKGFLQRGLVVECLAGVRDEDCRDMQGVAYDEDGAGGVPCAVAACLEGGADAAIGKTGCVGFLLYKLLAGKLLDHTALTVMLHKAVVLLGSTFGKWLEPVCTVCDAQLHCPFLHSLGNGICGIHVQLGAVVHNIAHLVIDIGRKVLGHFPAVEHIFGKKLAGTILAIRYLNGLSSEGLANYLKPDCCRHKPEITLIFRQRYILLGNSPRKSVQFVTKKPIFVRSKFKYHYATIVYL